MFTFKYPVVDLDRFAAELAKAMGTRMINNRFDVPGSIGNGYVQLVDLPNGLSAVIMNFTLDDDMHYEQSKSNEEWYTLHFEESQVTESFITQINGEYLKDSRTSHNSAYLVCSFFDLGYFFSKGSHIKCITIQMDKEWLGKYLRMDVYNEIVQQYIALKTASLHIENLDVEYKRIMAEIIEVDKNHPAPVTYTQNRIMALVERFFSHLYEKRYEFRYQVKASTHDIEQIRRVEDAITANVSERCPSIEELSKMVAMSPTKLKQLFKDIYGKPIYQYYQFYRMQKAKAMLLSKKFSIKEVGLSLGYTNLSNFTTAFFKEFNVLPSELLKR